MPKAPQPPPDLPLEIWLEIFQFATYVHQHYTIKPLDPFVPRRITTNAMGANTPSLAMRTKLALVLVSRSWRRIAVQILYRHVVIRSPARANAMLQAFERSRIPRPSSHSSETPHTTQEAQSYGYGEWTRYIEVYTFVRGSSDIKFLQTTFKILRCCPNLHFLSGNWIHQLPIEFLQGLSGVLGPSLLGLSWKDSDSLATPEFLGSFKSLRILDLRHFTGRDPAVRSPSAPRPTLPCVTDLIVSTHSRSLSTATLIDLPNLRNLTLRTPGWSSRDHEPLKAFLKVHGRCLLAVDLPPPAADSELDPDNAPYKRGSDHVPPDSFLGPEVCSNLESLTYSCTSSDFITLPHPNLRRIGIRGITAESLYPDKPSDTKTHLISLTVEKYPRLELIQTAGFLVEAHGDSMIKDVCIWWVERFEAMGVMFLDGEGVMWAYSEPEEPEVIHEVVILEKGAKKVATTEKC